jgi:hypothetical protein
MLIESVVEGGLQVKSLTAAGLVQAAAVALSDIHAMDTERTPRRTGPRWAAALLKAVVLIGGDPHWQVHAAAAGAGLCSAPPAHAVRDGDGAPGEAARRLTVRASRWLKNWRKNPGNPEVVIDRSRRCNSTTSAPGSVAQVRECAST